MCLNDLSDSMSNDPAIIQIQVLNFLVKQLCRIEANERRWVNLAVTMNGAVLTRLHCFLLVLSVSFLVDEVEKLGKEMK